MNLSVLQRLFPIFLLLANFNSIYAQNDSLLLENNNSIVGELKKMEKGVVTMKTAYSDSDFKIKWKEIKKISTKSEYLISIRKGKLYNGKLYSKVNDTVSIIKNKDTLLTVPIKNIVFLDEMNPGFLSKFSGSLSVGYNFAKAENLSELSIRSRLGYRAKRWRLQAKYNDIRSSRKDTNPVERLDAVLSYQYYLKNNWYTVTEVSFFSNTEQNIKLRTLAMLGIGKYLIQTNRMYWGLQLGANYNNENFDALAGEKKSQNSGELFLGTELSLYDFKDFNLLSKAVVYPSLTESKRWRLDYSIDLKYDLPLHFFIKLGFTFNYDNKPVAKSSQTDYIFQTTIGWDFN